MAVNPASEREKRSMIRSERRKFIMPVTKSDFGKVKNGQTVTAYTLTNASGASVTLLDLGCTIQSVIVPDKDGKMTDVTLNKGSVVNLHFRRPGLRAFHHLFRIVQTCDIRFFQ